LTENDWIDSRVKGLGTWVRSYYQNPTPDDLVEKVKEMSRVGVLEATGRRGRPDANIMFIGKVMQANPARIGEWMDRLASLPASEQVVLKRAVWYADSDAGRAWLVQHGEGELANGPRPMLFGDQVGFLLTSGDAAIKLEPHHLDQLWEWFFATGEAEPVIRLTKVFELAHDMPDGETHDLLSPPADTADKVQGSLLASNYRLVRPALWSATSLAAHDDRVLSILVEQREKADSARVRAWIQRVVEVAMAAREGTGRRQGE